MSPAELAAAEAAEKLHEQEKLDAALALRLQVTILAIFVINIFADFFVMTICKTNIYL